MRLRRPLAAILLGLACLVPTAPTLAGQPGQPGVSLSMEIGACDYAAETAHIPDDTLTVVHRSAGGALKAKHTFDVSIGGFVVGCPNPRVRTGDRIELRIGTAKTLLRTFTVPALTLTTARAFDRVKGKAPGVSSVKVEVTLCDVAFFGCTGLSAATVPVDPTTRAWTTTTDEDAKGGSYATVLWAKGSDQVYRTQRFAQLIVTPGSASVRGTGRTDDIRETVSLRRGDRLGSGTSRTTPAAAFSTTLKRSGAPMKVKTGDVLSSTIAGDATVTVFPTSLRLVPGGVEGTCRKNGAVTVMVRNAEGAVFFGYQPLVDASGHWAVKDTLPVGGTVESFCATKAGDVVWRRITIG
jgi:hypothetical protein